MVIKIKKSEIICRLALNTTHERFSMQPWGVETAIDGWNKCNRLFSDQRTANNRGSLDLQRVMRLKTVPKDVGNFDSRKRNKCFIIQNSHTCCIYTHKHTCSSRCHVVIVIVISYH